MSDRIEATFLKRALAAVAATPAYRWVLRFRGKLDHQTVRSLLGTLFETVCPEEAATVKASVFQQGRYALSDQGNGLLVGLNPVGGTPGDAMDHEFHLLFGDATALRCTVGDGYYQPTLDVTIDAESAARGAAVMAALKALMTAQGCVLASD